MSEYIFGILGIAISIGLFLLGYRQTIGAKKERIRSANGEIEKILLRRFVLDDFTSRVEDISRLIDGKARDFRVHPTDLLSEGQFLNNIFTRIVESDFIPREQREKVLDRLTPIIEEVEEQPMLEEALEALPSKAASMRIATFALGIMGGLASVVGALLVTIPKIREVQVSDLPIKVPELVTMVVITAVASFSMILFMIFLYRIRERQQEEPSKASALSDYVDFERDVVKILNEAGLGAQVAGPKDQGYDLIIEPEGRKILVEVKAWKRPMPSRIVSTAVGHLREAMSQEKASEAILVTRTNVRIPETINDDDRIKLMTLRDLRKYLAHAKSS